MGKSNVMKDVGIVLLVAVTIFALLSVSSLLMAQFAPANNWDSLPNLVIYGAILSILSGTKYLILKKHRHK
ncbi:MAG: hypothetical protein ACKVT0_08675 [Planctomycetaceae bacterium]